MHPCWGDFSVEAEEKRDGWVLMGIYFELFGDPAERSPVAASPEPWFDDLKDVVQGWSMRLAPQLASSNRQSVVGLTNARAATSSRLNPSASRAALRRAPSSLSAVAVLGLLAMGSVLQDLPSYPYTLRLAKRIPDCICKSTGYQTVQSSGLSAVSDG